MTDDSRQGTSIDGTASHSPVVDGLDDRVITLDSTDPETSLGDLKPLRETFAGRRVVGLGEATHGTREFFRLKHRLVRFLVEELGVRLFGLEASFAETLAIDEYVRHGEGDPEEALEGIYFWTWNTEEVLDLIEWLRAFNADRPPDDRVRFYGFDMQYTQGAADAVIGYLDEVDPEYLAAVRDDIDSLSDPGVRAWSADEDGALEAADRLLPDLRRAFDERREEYVSRSSAADWRLARQHVTVIGQAVELARAVRTSDGAGSEETLRVRDRAMAENVEWILDHEPGENIALWAHNDHVNRVATTSGGRSVTSMGGYLADRFGGEYYALGFEFGKGAFQALVESDGDGHELGERHLDEPLSDTAATFGALDHPLVFLDFEAARDDPVIDEWLDDRHDLHSIGAVYDPDQPEDHLRSCVLSSAFDGLCYVEETSRARSF